MPVAVEPWIVIICLSLERPLPKLHFVNFCYINLRRIYTQLRRYNTAEAEAMADTARPPLS